MICLEKIYEAKEYGTIKEYIRDAIKKFADKDAFILKSKENDEIKYKHVSFKEFGEEAEELGTGLIGLGLQNKRIAIIGHNSYSWVKSYISVVCGVGIVVPLDKGLQVNEIEMSLVRSKADAIIFENEFCR